VAGEIMKISITYRLFLSILAATCLSVLSMFFIMQWSIDRGFFQYLNSLDEGKMERMSLVLAKTYSEHGSWDFVQDNSGHWFRSLRPLLIGDSKSGRMKEIDPEKDGLPFPPPPPFGEGRRPRIPLVVLDAERKMVFGEQSDTKGIHFVPVIHNGITVGYVGTLSPKEFLHPLQVKFLKGQKSSLTLSALGMVLAVIVLSLPLAKRLVRPIRAIADATRDLAAGKYTARAAVSSSDELGQLARDFNSMAVVLENNERARRQWIADISHELRTPLAILRGEIEALLEGIRSTTPDAIRSLHAEALRLHRLVDDLYQLALSDLGTMAYRKEDLDLVELLRDTIETYRQEFDLNGIALRVNMSEDQEINVHADPERLHQLFANLLDNSLKYTDPGGSLNIRLATRKDQALVDLEDSAPGVSPSELNKLFDRFFRVETSRNRSSGGAGLGLAICKNIVEAHGGAISAHPSPLGGIRIKVAIPVTEGYYS